MYNNVKYGADPELFLVDNYGQYKSAIGIIGGSKANPRKLDNEGSAVQEDNVAVEFNIPPSSTKEQFVGNIGRVMGYLHDYTKEKGFSLAVVPAALFPLEELVHPMAKEFGCDPDFNVWTQEENPRPIVPQSMQNLRSCGGHLHVSWDKPHFHAQERMVKALDIFCGVPSIQLDGDTLRRKLYGKAGCFRFKNYGIEYRTLSNFWIKSPDLVEWLYTQAEKAVNFLNSGGEIKNEHSALVIDAINTGNEGSLMELQRYYPI